MTGYGRAEETIRGHHVTVEIKSVNHRYFEFGCRTPRGYAFLDDKIKTYLQSRLSRGKVDVYVSVETLEDAPVEVLVNHSLAEGYVNALQESMDLRLKRAAAINDFNQAAVTLWQFEGKL